MTPGHIAVILFATRVALQPLLPTNAVAAENYLNIKMLGKPGSNETITVPLIPRV